MQSEPTDEQIRLAIGTPYHCIDCVDDGFRPELNDYSASIERLRELFKS